MARQRASMDGSACAARPARRQVIGGESGEAFARRRLNGQARSAVAFHSKSSSSKAHYSCAAIACGITKLECGETLIRVHDGFQHRKARRKQRDVYAFASKEKLGDPVRTKKLSIKAMRNLPNQVVSARAIAEPSVSGSGSLLPCTLWKTTRLTRTGHRPVRITDGCSRM
jgi:hypothetical protein